MEIILGKFGELVLKGMNRRTFEQRLIKNLRYRLNGHGSFNVYSVQSTLYIEPENEAADMDAAFEEAKRLFGLTSVSRAYSCEKNLGAIISAAVEKLRPELLRARTFKVESKRSDKTFYLKSPELSKLVGGALDDAFENLRVDVNNPEITVYVEIRDYAAFVHADPSPGAGGLPVGSSGKAALLLSGGIDSPVAGYMIAKRGVELESIHFFSYPYTSERAKDKTLRLAEIISSYTGDMRVTVVPFTELQEALRESCPEDYFTILMRRSMFRIAETIARRSGCGALITGESLGQVASQTMEALAVTGEASKLTVLRPLIGLDKEEIVTISRKIGALSTSILPYEDCCTVFTPRHPKTKPSLGSVLEIEATFDFADIEARAVEGAEEIYIKRGGIVG